jgi:hypothetical protein
MNAFEPERRSFLFSVGGLAVYPMLQQTLPSDPGVVRRGYVFGATDGEHLAGLYCEGGSGGLFNSVNFLSLS